MSRNGWRCWNWLFEVDPFLRSSTSWVWISCCATLRQVCSASLNSVLVSQLVFLEEEFLILWVNLKQYVAVLSSLDRVVNMVMNSVGKQWVITLTNVKSSSNAGSGCFINWVVGQSNGCWCSHLGPCHHNLQFFKVSGFVSRDEICWIVCRCNARPLTYSGQFLYLGDCRKLKYSTY
jgi:hypothetical protein